MTFIAIVMKKSIKLMNLIKKKAMLQLTTLILSSHLLIEMSNRRMKDMFYHSFYLRIQMISKITDKNPLNL